MTMSKLLLAENSRGVSVCRLAFLTSFSLDRSLFLDLVDGHDEHSVLGE
jgi:hypothetical protein